MNESPKTIDARGQACPGPVILLKKALEAGDPGPLDILVDNEAARENVSRFAKKKGREILASTGAPPEILVRVGAPPGTAGSPAAGAASPGPAATRSASPGPAPTGASAPLAAPAAAGAGAAGAERPLALLIASDRLGQGNDELGALLMRGFLHALAEGEEEPETLILMNHGVLLAIEGAETLEKLRRLEDQGVEVLACGTCLEYLGVKDRLAVGRVSNMYEIAELLAGSRVLSL